MRSIVFVARLGCLAVLLGMVSGCALLEKETWNLERYRDERARDIDARLSEDRPIVQNPF